MRTIEWEEYADPNLVKEVRKYGKFDTNACLSCGGCTLTCTLSSNETSFSLHRCFQFVRAGLRERLLNDLGPWLCYYCGDCSVSCPRKADPGETMMTLRRYLTAQYDWTGLASKIYKSKLWEIGSLLTVGVIVLFLIIFYHLVIEKMTFSGFGTNSMGMEHMFDIITYFTIAVFLIPFFLLCTNAVRMYWLTIHRNSQIKVPFSLYLTEFKTLLLHIFIQKKFNECTERNRWLKHFLIASSTFLMCIIVFFFLKWFQTDNIYPLYHPQRWLGYLITIAMLYGTGEILIGRIRKKEELHKFSENSDIVFPLLLFLTAFSGILSHIFRYLGIELAVHYTYAIHIMITVPMLIIEIPFGKWSHGLYRALAIYFYRIKEKAFVLQQNKEIKFSLTELN